MVKLILNPPKRRVPMINFFMGGAKLAILKARKDVTEAPQPESPSQNSRRALKLKARMGRRSVSNQAIKDGFQPLPEVLSQDLVNALSPSPDSNHSNTQELTSARPISKIDHLSILNSSTGALASLGSSPFFSDSQAAATPSPYRRRLVSKLNLTAESEEEKDNEKANCRKKSPKRGREEFEADLNNDNDQEDDANLNRSKKSPRMSPPEDFSPRPCGNNGVKVMSQKLLSRFPNLAASPHRAAHRPQAMPIFSKFNAAYHQAGDCIGGYARSKPDDWAEGVDTSGWVKERDQFAQYAANIMYQHAEDLYMHHAFGWGREAPDPEPAPKFVPGPALKAFAVEANARWQDENPLPNPTTRHYRRKSI